MQQPLRVLPTASYWLVPRSQPDRAALRGVIEELAGEFRGAPVFTPHLTLHVVGGLCSEQDVLRALGEAGGDDRTEGPIVLRVAGVGHSPEFFKTLFLEFEPDAVLGALARNLAARFPNAGYVFRPHLSLLYRANLDESTRAVLAGRLADKLRGTTVAFSVLAAIGPGEGHERFEDAVEEWESVGTCSL